MRREGGFYALKKSFVIPEWGDEIFGRLKVVHSTKNGDEVGVGVFYDSIQNKKGILIAIKQYIEGYKPDIPDDRFIPIIVDYSKASSRTYRYISRDIVNYGKNIRFEDAEKIAVHAQKAAREMEVISIRDLMDELQKKTGLTPVWVYMC